MTMLIADPVLSEGLPEELPMPEQFKAPEFLNKDLKAAALMLSRDQARFLVEEYYRYQRQRIASAAQVREADKSGKPSRAVAWVADTWETMEKNIQKMLGLWAAQWTVGAWMQAQVGIGPVISAGLLAHLDIRQSKTCGHFWRFAGLDPTMVWEKKTKRPWNAALKTLCAVKLGECFVKTCGNKKAFYGPLYRQYKDALLVRNEQGKFAERAATILSEKKFKSKPGDDAEKAYKSAVTWYGEGKLPPAHIHAMARRQAVKMFLSHLHEVMYRDYFGEAPPVPYVFTKTAEDHRHFIAPPMWPMQKPGRSLREMLPELPPINDRDATKPE